jgi:hypothetical protein
VRAQCRSAAAVFAFTLLVLSLINNSNGCGTNSGGGSGVDSDGCKRPASKVVGFLLRFSVGLRFVSLALPLRRTPPHRLCDCAPLNAPRNLCV